MAQRRGWTGTTNSRRLDLFRAEPANAAAGHPLRRPWPVIHGGRSLGYGRPPGSLSSLARSSPMKICLHYRTRQQRETSSAAPMPEPDRRETTQTRLVIWTTVVLASPWPCKAYCGRCELCHVASEREVAIRERQLEQRSTRRWRRAHVPLDRTEREALLRDVMRNLRVQLGPGPASGEEVDRLVRELTSGRSEDWATFSQWVMSYIRGRAAVMGVPSEGVDDVASAVLEKVARALMARQQLSSAEPARDTVPALLACFTHTFPLRPWAASLSKNALSDAQRRLLRFEDTTLDAYHADHGEVSWLRIRLSTSSCTKGFPVPGSSVYPSCCR